LGDLSLEARNRFERYPRLTLIAVVSILLLVLDLVLARLAGPVSSPGEVEKSYRVVSRIYHHDLKAKMKVDGARWGHLVYRVRTNSLGFKDATTRDVPLSPPGHRIVFIGDSFAEGIGYPYEDTFVGILAKRLADRDVEVLNASVASYSPITYLRKIQYLVEERNLGFHELFVFIDISDAQDEMFYELDEDGVVALVPRSPEYRKWLRFVGSVRAAAMGGAQTSLPGRLLSFQSHSMVLRVLLRLKDALLSPDPGEAVEVEWSRALRNRRTLWTVDEKLRKAYADLGIKRAIGHMDQLEKLTRNAGIALAVAVYPRRVQIHHRDLDSLQVRIWKEWASRHGIPILDFFGGPRAHRGRVHPVLRRRRRRLPQCFGAVRPGGWGGRTPGLNPRLPRAALIPARIAQPSASTRPST
jgi:hypothetical protein